MNKMDNFAVVLVEPKYEGNIGYVARVMKNFGFSRLILINPFPKLGDEAFSRAMHGFDILERAEILESLEEVKEEFDFLIGTTAITASDRNPWRTPIFPEMLKKSLSNEGKKALIFGREDHGLLNEEIEKCDLLVTIPASEEYPTLNLSHSVAIILYELSKHLHEEKLRKLKKFREAGKIEKDVLLRMFNNMVDQLIENDFESKLAKKTFKELIGRAFISGRETFTLIGVFRKACEKLKNQK
ncbi:MAG TPA: RNA methyltransferase [Candidatus Altiarchaeales archaeon]|nr:RNA methyltransferase [Candidatus Altiarchaeales archaeon]